MGRLTTILFPTQFKELTLASLERLACLKAAGLTKVILLNVLDRDEVGYVPFGGFDRAQAAELREKASLAFSDWEARLAELGLAAHHIIEVGDPEPKILEVAEREGAQLIVVGRHVKVTDALYPTGVEMNLLRDTKIPVLLLPPEEEVQAPDGAALLSNVTFAAELAEGDGTPLAFLSALKGCVGNLSLLNVVKPVEVDSLSEAESEDLNQARREKLARLAEHARTLGLPAETHLRSGVVAPEILSFCAETAASAVVLGTRGKRGISELIVGSVSHEVAVHSKIPVILVPLRG